MIRCDQYLGEPSKPTTSVIVYFMRLLDLDSSKFLTSLFDVIALSHPVSSMWTYSFPKISMSSCVEGSKNAAPYACHASWKWIPGDINPRTPILIFNLRPRLKIFRPAGICAQAFCCCDSPTMVNIKEKV